MSEGFLMDPKAAELFFRFCMRYKLDRLEDRTVVLREIVRRKKAKYLQDTREFTKGRNVLQVKRGPR